MDFKVFTGRGVSSLLPPPPPPPRAAWHEPLFTISKQRLEMADAMGFASLSPRRGIICPVILGQWIPPQLRLKEGRGRGSWGAGQKAVYKSTNVLNRPLSCFAV